MKKPTHSSILKIITVTNERYLHGESEYAVLNSRLQSYSIEELILRGITYHKACYENLTNKTNVERAKVRFDKGTTSKVGCATDIRTKKRGRPSSSGVVESVSEKYDTPTFHQRKVCYMSRK